MTQTAPDRAQTPSILPTPATLPVALTIAGSDSGGGAGIQADLKTFEALGVFGTSAITAITAQNTTGVRSIQGMDAQIVKDQIDMVVEDLKPGAAKTGMIATPDLIRLVANSIQEYQLAVVVDPVMVAASGARLIQDDAVEALKNELFPVASLITPNRMEAETLTGHKIENLDDALRAGRELLELGPKAVLVKGGHIDGMQEVVDLLVTREGTQQFKKPRIDTRATHGTGCTLAAGIAAGLAKGLDQEAAIRQAEDLIEHGLRFGYTMGTGSPSVHHLARLRNDAARWQVLTELRLAREELLEIPGGTRLCAEVGMNLAACTPYAVDALDVAATEGRITSATTPAGIRLVANGSIDFGASKHMARLLLTLRRYDPEIGAVMNVRHTPKVLAALEALGWDVVEADRANEPEQVKEQGSSMDWAARFAMQDRTEAPDAITDPGEPGKEAMVRLIAGGPGELVEMFTDLVEQVLDK